MRRAVTAIVLSAVIASATAWVVATYPVLSATADEPQHVAAGLDWLGGRYDLWRAQGLPHVAANPPLGRVAVALGPWARGLRVTGLRDLLYAGAGYDANLRSARAGTLPFLALLLLATFWLARQLHDTAAGLVAASALAAVPAVLGHAGLATTDAAAAATVTLAALAMIAWLAAPTPRRAALLGLALGAALATKLSALALLPAWGVLGSMRWRAGASARSAQRAGGGGRAGGDGAGARRVAAQVAGALGLAGLVVWAAYRFSVGRPAAIAGPELSAALAEGCFSSEGARRMAARALALPLPAPELWDGLLALCAHGAPGRSTSFLLGRLSQDGFAAFFPIALAVKTPLPFLVLAAAGVAAAAREAPARRWRALAPAVVALVLLAAVVPSRINVGVRHVLAIYPLLAVYAGAGAVSLWRAARTGPRATGQTRTRQRARTMMRGAAVVMGAWLLSTPARAAPDHLAWFNALAGRHPERVLLDSDLDWGQDLGRLERELAARGVPRVSLAVFGPADLCRHRLPPGRWLRPHERARGWIAVSEMYRQGVVGFSYTGGDYCDRASFTRAARPDPSGYAWLDAETPVARVGSSILLYEVR